MKSIGPKPYADRICNGQDEAEDHAAGKGQRGLELLIDKLEYDEDSHDRKVQRKHAAVKPCEKKCSKDKYRSFEYRLFFAQ